jgi:hypothetical protein
MEQELELSAVIGFQGKKPSPTLNTFRQGNERTRPPPRQRAHHLSTWYNNRR